MQSMNRILMNGLKGMLIILTAAVTFSVCWGVFTRFVLQSAADWTGEFSGYCLVWITFLGSAYAVFKGSHIRFESLVEALPKPLRIIVETLFNVAMLVFVTVITVYGGKLAFSTMGDDTLSLPFTKGVVYLILPIGGAIMMLGFVIELFKVFSTQKNADKKENMESVEQIMMTGGK